MKQPGQRTLLGFDFGTRSIGVAIGQEITGSAQPLRALKANDGVPNWEEIDKLLQEWQPDRVVVGLPLGYALARCLTYVLAMPSLYFDVTVAPVSYVVSAALAILFTLVVNVMTDRSLDRIDMVGALKSAE